MLDWFTRWEDNCVNFDLLRHLLKLDTLRKLAHKIYRDFLAVKIEKFKWKIFDIFPIFAQNIDCACGYTLEPPQRDGSNEYPQ